MPLTDLQVRETEIYGILSQLSSIKDIKVSVGKELWPGEKNLPDIVLGTVNQWVHKERMQIKITWTEADGSMAHDSEDLHILLLPHVNFKLLKGSKGEALLLRGQARAEHQARVPKKTVSIPYTVGAVTRQQVWTIEDDPEAIVTDARTEPRSKPQLARRRDDIKTPFDCWYNAAVSHKMFDKMELAFNQRLDGKSYETRKTSRGELVRFVGMMGALAGVVAAEGRRHAHLRSCGRRGRLERHFPPQLQRVRHQDVALLPRVLYTRRCSAARPPAHLPIRADARVLSRAGKLFAVCNGTKRNCMEQHRSCPKDKAHTHRFAHGPQGPRRKKATPPAPRTPAAGAKRAAPAPAAAAGAPAAQPGKRQKAGASTTWDPKSPGMRHGEDKEERGSSAEDSDSSE